MTALRKRRGAARRRPSRRAADAPPVPPTPETRARLRRDLVLGLYEDGRLREEHVRATVEIRRVWEAFSRALGPRARDPRAGAIDRSHHHDRQPVEWLSAAEEAIWRHRYRPWAAEAARRSAGGTVRVTLLHVVVDLVVDNHGLREVEAWYRMRHGAAFTALRDGLHRYADLARWVGHRGTDRRRD